MLNKRTKKESDSAIHASIKKEMAKPRMTKSARIAESKLHSARKSQQPTATQPELVEPIIP